MIETPGTPNAVGSDALPCPLCGYDLRGLPPGRCPECGHEFDPAELRAAMARASSRPLPWLVEYGWRDGDEGHVPLPAWMLTPLVTLRPRRFWRLLRPEMPVRPQRLAFYWLATAAAGLAGVAASTAAIAGATMMANRYNYSYYGGSGSWPRFAFEVRQAAAESALLTAVIVLLWPVLSLLTLVSLRASLRQARVRGEHLVRVVAYAGDAVLWAGPILGLTRLAFSPAGVGNAVSAGLNLRVHTDDGAVVAAALLSLVFGYRLTVAYRRYLRFPHPTATVLATQAILWLLLAVALLNGLDWQAARLLFG